MWGGNEKRGGQALLGVPCFWHPEEWRKDLAEHVEKHGSRHY